jgi:uncharacterized protein
MSRASVYWARLGAVTALLLSVVLGTLGSPSAVAAQTSPDGESGVSGSSYTSPSFGYSLEWDRSWEVTDEKVEDDYNMLRLDDEASILYFEGYSPALDVDECLTTYGISYVENVSGVSDFENTAPDESADGVLSSDLTFVLTYADDETGEDVSVDFNGYVSCQEINDGDANLVVTHLGIADGWDDEVAGREDILDTLTFDGETASTGSDEDDGEAPDEPTEAPDDSGDTGDTGTATDVVMSDPQGDGDLPANSDELLDLFQSSINDIDEFWSREFPLISGGQEYQAPTEFIPFAGAIDTPCGPADSFDESTGLGSGPFYCPPNQTIYLDMGFANFQFDQVGQVPFLIPVVLAHEIGHHVQDLLGMEVCYSTPCLDPNELTSQEIEYMADCYAGSWSRDAELRGRLGSRDIDANIVQYAVILGGGSEGADPGGHGRGAERVWWFLNGYLEGSAKCFETSKVTANWAQSGPPTANATSTPQPDEEPTSTPEEANRGAEVAAMGDAVETSQGTITITETELQTKIERRTADGTYLIVFLDVVRPEGEDAPFVYDGWTVVDGDGTAYELDGRATDVLLSTAYDDGADEVLQAGEGYTIAFVFDVPEEAADFVLTNEDEGVSVQLDQ